MSKPCECVNWGMAIPPQKYRGLKMALGLPAITNHHENCPHYNDSLIDVWKVAVDGVSCYVDNEQDARDTAVDSHRVDIVITKERMHREVFEHLPEFERF